MIRKRFFALFCLAVLGVYGLATHRGWAFSNPPAAVKAPQGLRASGYRSYSYWSGGK